MGCRVRVNRHGYLGYRLYFQGYDVLEGARLKDNLANRQKVEERARVIDREIRENCFDYLHWFPHGNLVEQLAGGRMGRTSRITMGRFFSEWSRNDSPRVSAKWRATRESYLRTHVLSELGRIFLDDLEPRHLTRLQDRLLGNGLAPSTVDRVIHSALRGMLRDARLAGYRVAETRDLFTRGMVGRLDDASHPRIVLFSNEERDRILQWFASKRPGLSCFVYFLFWTGVRPSEATALRWGEVHFERRTVHIRRSRVLGQDGRPKTGKSRRDVLIDDDLRSLLRRLKPANASHDEFVFVGSGGKPLEQNNFRERSWRRALQDLKIRPRPAYATRHTYISTLLAAGATPLFVAKQTGTSLQMIEKHYGNHWVTSRDLTGLVEQAKRPPRAPAQECQTGGPMRPFQTP